MRSVMIRIEDRIQISERIREIRLNAELLQYEFGERLGVGCVTVNRWENFAQLPPMKMIRKMAEEFNTTPQWILYGSDET
ncbi:MULTISPECIES: helix-turn-helix domain-containing protein [Staphylococcus]|mgnify:FL=1|uniref:Helix-turn-helix transcriptional regulator n=1 Tax=Staphylococcus capitis TaxID=29388 RepID=A0ABX1SPC7_STACP|nr:MULTISPECIES: helix-turn-helix transcriptional regulator [Staphylococcus]MBF8049255.1 helix-turn-helix transcriptional regulator [Staphylococcus capitis]MBF8132008.1 helix-turn-helix transcriptional regulator [Staphylococcus capitis]MBU5271265.1 helix-turn-helix domain-containing protein [Staphylococcus caprae]MCC2081230.1 helix-turn-helix domain-containing protein [Staphylococcus capitis]MDK6297097.1 helix-turn-helix transcriptional regulator [Staphylococcus caprae]